MSKTVQSKPAKKSAVRRIATIALSIVLVVLVGYLWTGLGAFDFNVNRLNPAFPQTRVPDTPGQNILLLGSDSQVGAGNYSDQAPDPNAPGYSDQRSDSMMVVHIPRGREPIYVMSIMRDSWVDIPGHGEAKINAAYAFGGVPLTVQVVENYIGARIDHVAEVDFSGFEGITEALGGVDVQNDIPFSAGGFTFDQGTIHVEGEQALWYVRERHSFSDGDFQRVRNQQAFIKGVFSEFASPSTWLNPITMNRAVGALAQNLNVDWGLNGFWIMSTGVGELFKFQKPEVVFFTSPSAGFGTSVDGQSYIVVDTDKQTQLQQAFQKDELGTYVSSQ